MSYAYIVPTGKDNAFFKEYILYEDGRFLGTPEIPLDPAKGYQSAFFFETGLISHDSAESYWSSCFSEPLLFLDE